MTQLHLFNKQIPGVLFFICLITFLKTGSYAQSINKNWNQELLSSLQEFVNCENTNPNGINPCNQFVGSSLNIVYKINDFYSQKLGRYMLTHEISSFVKESGKWTLLGHGYEQKALTAAQGYANANKAVVAIYLNAENIGHVALILPGELRTSGSWGFHVPNSASFFTSDPQNSYVGKSLSYAFGRDLIRHVVIYGREY